MYQWAKKLILMPQVSSYRYFTSLSLSVHSWVWHDYLLIHVCAVWSLTTNLLKYSESIQIQILLILLHKLRLLWDLCEFFFIYSQNLKKKKKRHGIFPTCLLEFESTLTRKLFNNMTLYCLVQYLFSLIIIWS